MRLVKEWAANQAWSSQYHTPPPAYLELIVIHCATEYPDDATSVSALVQRVHSILPCAEGLIISWKKSFAWYEPPAGLQAPTVLDPFHPVRNYADPAAFDASEPGSRRPPSTSSAPGPELSSARAPRAATASSPRPAPSRSPSPRAPPPPAPPRPPRTSPRLPRRPFATEQRSAEWVAPSSGPASPPSGRGRAKTERHGWPWECLRTGAAFRRTATLD